MKYKIRRALALFTTFLMLFSSIPANTLTAFAADDAEKIAEEYDGNTQNDEQDAAADEADPDGNDTEDPGDGDDADQQDPDDEEPSDGDEADTDDEDPSDGDEADTDDENEESYIVKVSFDANGGSFDDGKTKRTFDQNKGEKITILPDDPARDGYEFAGWCLDADGEYTLSLAGYVIDENVTFYAGWAEAEPDMEVVLDEAEVPDPDMAGTGLTLDGNGGTIRYYDYNVYEYKTAEVVNYVPRYDGDYYWKNLSDYSPEREGYFFTGWYAEPECSTRLSDDDSESYLAERPDAGTTLYAGWSNEYVTVTCVFGDSAYYYGTDSNWEKVHEMDVEVPKNKTFYRSQYLPDTNYIHCDDEHYTFDLWGATPQSDKEVTFKFSEDTTLYAVYKKSKIQITYDTNITDGGYFREYSGGKTVRAGQKTEFTDKNSRKSIYVSSSDYVPRNDDPRKVFAGWYTDAGLTTPVAKYSDWNCTQEWDGTGSSYYIKTGNDDFTLYAKWEESDDVCILTFDPNVEGGYFKDYNTIYEVVEKYQLGCRAGESISETIYNPINPDKAFQCVGWYSDKAFTKQVIAVGKYEGQYNSSAYLDGYTFPEGVKEVTLYAKWVKTYATVTFDAGDDGSYRYYDGNGYSVGNRISVKVNSSGKAETCPNDPVSTDPHKVFAGWYLNGKKIDSLYEYKFSTTAGEKINVVAQWTSCYAVTVNYNGGYYEKWDSDLEKEVHKKESYVIKVPCGDSLGGSGAGVIEPYYEGNEKVFRGWYLSTDTDHKTQITPWSFVPEGDCELVALWADNFTVTFDAGTGKFTDGKSKRNYNAVEGTVYIYNNGAEIPEEPEIDDDTKVFGGWCINGNKVERDDILNAKITGNVTYTAQYLTAYAVTFDPKGGSFVSKTANVEGTSNYKIKVAVGESIRGKVPTVKSADAEHKVFSGWYTDENCTPESLVDPYEMAINNPVTLYAGWTECYKLTFHANFVNNVSGSERYGEHAKFANGSETIVVKVVKGTAYRYGEDYGKEKESVDILFESPKIADAAGGYQLPWWWTNAEKKGDKYVLSRYNSHIEKKEGNYTYYEYFNNMYGFIPISDMDFYADITTETVELSFNANGGKYIDEENSKYYGFYTDWTEKGYNPRLNSAHTVWTLTVPKGITYGELSNSEPYGFASKKSGYSYYEWAYKDASCKNRAYSDLVIDKNMTLYCRWYNSGSGGGSSSGGKNAEITYHAGEGYLQNDRDCKSTCWSYTYGTTNWQIAPLPAIDDDTRSFAGWYYDAELTEPYPAAYQMIKYEWGEFNSYVIFPDKVDDLYAAYGPAYTVVFDANGGYFDADYNRTKDPGLNMRETTTLRGKAYPGQSLIISEYTKRVRRDGNKIFDGWYTDKACSDEKRVTVYALDEKAELYRPSGPVTLYAKWVEYEAAPIKLTASTTKKSIDIGESATLSVRIDSETDIEENSVHWFISGYSIGKLNVNRELPAKLDIDGRLVGRAQGTVYVYAMVNGVRSDELKIEVSNETVQSTITLTDENGDEFVDDVALLKGEGLVLYGVIEPGDTADDLAQAVVWESSSTSVAEVTPAGDGRNANVIAVGEGTATITATLGKKTATVTVIVTDPVKLSEKELIMTARADADRALNIAVLKSVPDSDVEIKAFTTSECETESDLLSIVKGDAENTSTKKMIPVTISPTLESFDIEETYIITIQAKVVVDGKTYTDVCTLTLNPQAAAGDVTASVESGSVVDKGTKVLLNTSTSGTEIYYTKDGNDPNPTFDEDGNLPAGTYHYDDAIVINETVTIKAVAVRDGRKNSAIQTFTYKVESWGDVGQSLKETHFHDSLAEVPTGIWYVIGENVYTADGDTAFEKVYTGTKITFNDQIAVYSGTARLIENRDYTITYANNTAVMQDLSNKKAPSFTIKGKGNYAKTAVFKFKIKPAPVADIELTSESVIPMAVGPKVKLISTKPTVSFVGKKLTYNKDYLLEYYEGDTVDAAKIVDANTEIVDTAGMTYTIRVVAKEGGSFTGTNGVTVTVRTIDSKDKMFVKTSTLKVGDVKGKAIKLPYHLDDTANPDYYNPDGTVNFEAVFDNRSAEKTPLAYVYTKKVTEPLIYGVDYTVEAVGDNVNAGKYTFIVKGKTEGKGDDEIKYVGTKMVAYEITGVDLGKMKVAGLLGSVEYTGDELTLDDVFNTKDKTLTAHNAAVDPSEAWTGVTLYTTYKEKVGKTTVTRYITLEEGVDYYVAFNNTGVVGTHNLVFYGIGAYSGMIKKTVSVKAYNVNDAAKGAESKITITLKDPVQVYSKAGVKPEVIVKYGEKLLKENIDYTVSYKNNNKIVTDYNELKANVRPVVIIKGKGNFTGTNQTVYFNIAKANVADSVVLDVADVAYNPKGKSGYFLVTPKLMDNGSALTVGKNKDVDAIDKNAYEYYYAEDTIVDGREKSAGERLYAYDNIPAGTMIEVRVKVTISKAEKGSKIRTTDSPYYAEGEGNTAVLNGYYRLIGEGMDISKYTVTLKKNAVFNFNNGNDVVPVKSEAFEISYKIKGQKEPVILTGDDYEVVSVTNNKAVGTATVVLRGKGEYGGTKTVKFKISSSDIKAAYNN